MTNLIDNIYRRTCLNFNYHQSICLSIVLDSAILCSPLYLTELVTNLLMILTYNAVPLACFVRSFAHVIVRAVLSLCLPPILARTQALKAHQ